MAPHINSTVIWAFPVSQLRYSSWKQPNVCATLCCKYSLAWFCRMRGHIQFVLPETVLYPVSAHRLPTIAICSKFNQLPSFPHFFYCYIAYNTFNWILDQLKARGIIPEKILPFSCCEQFLRTKAFGKTKTSGTERLVRDWCHSRDKCLVILTHPHAEPLTNKFQPCLLSSLRTEIYEKLKFCGRHLSQALTTQLSHPLLFGLPKLNSSAVCYVDLGNAVTSAELAKQHTAIKQWAVLLLAALVVSSSAPCHCRLVGLCPQKLPWWNMCLSLVRFMQ